MEESSIINYINSLVQRDQDIFEFDVNLNNMDRLVELASETFKPRQDAYCHCDDVDCPHKAIINPLMFSLFINRLHERIKIKDIHFDRFDPNIYPILEDDHVSLFTPTNQLYKRCYKTININNNRVGIPRYADILEGFSFNPEDNITSITLRMNSAYYKFKVINNEFRPKNFIIPLDNLMFTQLDIIFDENDNIPSNFKILYGVFFLSVRFSLLTIKYRFKIPFEHDEEKYLIVVQEGMGFINN